MHGGGRSTGAQYPTEQQRPQADTTAPRYSGTSEFSFDNRFGKAEAPAHKHCTSRRALDYGKVPSGIELDTQAHCNVSGSDRSPREDAILARQRRGTSSLPLSRGHPAPQRLPNVSPAACTRQNEASASRLLDAQRRSSGSAICCDRVASALKGVGQAGASGNAPLPEVVFAYTARSARMQPQKKSQPMQDSHSLDMARRALLRMPRCGGAQSSHVPVPQAPRRHRHRLLHLLPALSKRSSQPGLMPCSSPEQPSSVCAVHSEISCALQCMGSMLTSTAASALQNPGSVDHTDNFSKFDSSELVTVRGAPPWALRRENADVT